MRDDRKKRLPSKEELIKEVKREETARGLGGAARLLARQEHNRLLNAMCQILESCDTEDEFVTAIRKVNPKISEDEIASALAVWHDSGL